MRLEPVIGLEIHVQLKTESKMFCSCPNCGDLEAPNVNICPTCTGQPGTLPNINARAVEMGMLISYALGGEVAGISKFDRKNYFYPDLPKGYQISQFDLPVSQHGKLSIRLNEGRDGEREFTVGITRLHLEEDAAKLLHVDGGDGKSSLVDFNRAGTPLAEIVTEPDLRSPEEAKAFLQELRLIMRYLDVSDADMEKGQLRCDANISLREVPEDPKNENWSTQLNPKTEIKNLNSFRSVERALEFEIKRQTKLWLDGQIPSILATRGWDDARGVTVEQRTKEESSDYRYFPEPDLPPMDLTDTRDRLSRTVPELPEARRRRFVEQYGLTLADARTFCDQPDLADYAERVFSELDAWAASVQSAGGQALTPERAAKLVSGWVLTKLNGVLSAHKLSLETMKAGPENMAELLTMIHNSQVTGTNALLILEEMVLSGADPSQVMEEKVLGQMENLDELREAAKQAIADNPKPVEDWCGGKTTAVQFLVGQVMKATRGKAPPEEARRILEEELSKL
ncbi:Asp-tRNA(Asn)/Glu-tRNA(Gln) amidotransferase subunit GatB [Candidatus Uhrbacteria bacterium CG_4_10_14_0_8_um_filter_58_22]|uniref:Aspartyl/glutamyl-tRNA(Asn/Gln) amidotransferase subunit B n=1 Tax=Candidatus Uhrbacteria bacterium CG_4_10_14_0_8_um_filter_58_22 TaxID=1975029 RepID=A0A2M7QBL1_9BACT|nr:MAG: glutaminyl-tRNA synthase (glutamine-hydrolyzing) subunit B [Parcubacteria group bacterium CG1_02_58_44]PIY63133.1 MAG: Asp-tRNA(Asn)/Glu-tRNA(Gln) amidotransferase subunit GatB [Candidatus Uhrbacteria bacterium CG_4_10_14_0_8_um_filter_58_22]